MKKSSRTLILAQVGHKPGTHGKPGKLREFEKLLKYQGILREMKIVAEKPGKLMKNVKHAA